MTSADSACLAAHGDATTDPAGDAAAAPLVVAVFATGVATQLVHFAHHLGWRTVVVDPAGVPDDVAAAADTVADRLTPELVEGADVVLTDHHRDEIGPLLRDALAAEPRWVGIMGSRRHEAPHPAALRALGVDEDEIGRVHRPIGLDIGSQTPPEIALSTLAGLVADRAGRDGAFHDRR